MANESLFAFATNYAEARAKALGGNIVKGAAAFEVEDAPVRRDLSETQFNIGDKIVIPATADSEQWICTPLTRGQNPVTRALCEVTASDGTKSVKELFLGTLMSPYRTERLNRMSALLAQSPTSLRIVLRRKKYGRSCSVRLWKSLVFRWFLSSEEDSTDNLTDRLKHQY